jgi:hypothetical protein
LSDRPKTLTPGQRNLAALRKACPAELPDDYWKQCEADRPWAPLNDEEWAGVWAVMRRLLREPTAELEARARSKTDNAALLSSYFSGYKRSDFLCHQGTLLNSVRERELYLKSVETFRAATAAMIGPENSSSFDPYRKYKDLLSYLDTYLAPMLRKNIAQDKERAKRLARRPSAAQPERDLWMARLVITWRDAGLDDGHKGPGRDALKAFILAAMRPHEPTISDIAPRYFLQRWRAGKIDKPPPHYAFK